jgi:hypothetical protein
VNEAQRAGTISGHPQWHSRLWTCIPNTKYVPRLWRSFMSTVPFPGLTAGPIHWRSFGPDLHVNRFIPGLTAGPIHWRSFGPDLHVDRSIPGLTAGPIRWRSFGPDLHVNRFIPGLTAGPIHWRSFGPDLHVNRSIPGLKRWNVERISGAERRKRIAPSVSSGWGRINE